MEAVDVPQEGLELVEAEKSWFSRLLRRENGFH